jgi:hypothetical protein
MNPIMTEHGLADYLAGAIRRALDSEQCARRILEAASKVYREHNAEPFDIFEEGNVNQWRRSNHRQN